MFHRLLHNVRLSSIPCGELERVLMNALISPSSDIYFLANSILETRKIMSNKSSYMETRDSESVVNFRGMELALIKVGGFGLSGITNEVTYFLPSLKKWCHLTSIPHVEQVSVQLNCLCSFYIIVSLY